MYVYICLVIHESEHLSQTARDSFNKAGGIFMGQILKLFMYIPHIFSTKWINHMSLNSDESQKHK